MKILVTGFDPFGGETINPSWEVVKSLPDFLKGHEIHKIQIPTVFGESFRVLSGFWDRIDPQVVLSVGQAGGRTSLSVERVAINLDDARIGDNRNKRPVDVPVVPGGGAAYFSNLPVKAMVKAIEAERVPAALSYTAGTFVCNHIMYSVLHRIHSGKSDARGGFIHIPYLPRQVIGKGDVPSMSADTVRKGLIAALGAVIDNQSDISVSMGRVC